MEIGTKLLKTDKKDYDGLESFYDRAKQYIINSEYIKELNHVEGLDFNKTTADHFMAQYAFVVLNTGMKNQVAELMYKRLVTSRWNPDTVRHPHKRKAIITAINNYVKWFNDLKSIPDERRKIEFLETLPFIGKITKYHLARNIGLDCAKPDRHLVVLSKVFDWDTPRHMCEYLAKKFGDRIGVVDVVLWRVMNLGVGQVWINEMKQGTL